MEHEVRRRLEQIENSSLKSGCVTDLVLAALTFLVIYFHKKDIVAIVEMMVKGQ